MIGKLADKVLKKKWSEEEVDKYVGNYIKTYLSFASDSEIRSKSASGGVTSALLIHAIESGSIDGAVVCKTEIQNGKVRAKFIVAESQSEILNARGSKYVETRFLREVLPLIENYKGKLAIVGLPCDITALKRHCNRNPLIGNSVALTIGLVCGHNSKVELIDEITKRIESECQQNIIDYKFRIGHWRGYIEATLEDGSVVRKPSKFFNDYQNLFFFSEKKCMACSDHYAYDADITLGDVWMFKLKDNPIKHTGVIIRSNIGMELYTHAVRDGVLEHEEMRVEEILDGQSRIGPSHYNVSSRVKAGKLLNVKLKDTVNEPVSPHSYLNALITIFNMKFSSTKKGANLIFKTPRFFIRLYLFFKKGLESLK